VCANAVVLRDRGIQEFLNSTVLTGCAGLTRVEPTRGRHQIVLGRFTILDSETGVKEQELATNPVDRSHIRCYSKIPYRRILVTKTWKSIFLSEVYRTYSQEAAYAR
jgi:hypothetical protein